MVAENRLGHRALLRWLRLSAGKYYDWAQRYGKINQHNGSVPRDFWLADWEKTAILDFQLRYPLEGYRRLTYMMIDADVVAVSPSSVFRVSRDAGRLGYFPRHPSKKGTGFEQPLAAHEHWHIDTVCCPAFTRMCNCEVGTSHSGRHDQTACGTNDLSCDPG